MSDEEIREKHEDLRGKAKVILLGKIYGQTDKGLAARLNITPDEAEKISGFLSKRYVRLFENIFKKLKDAQVRWFVRTDAGHLRVLPDGASFYSSKTQNCIRNYNIQAAAAGTFFKAALRIHQHLKDFFTPDNRIVFLLHDSVLVEAAEADVERIRTVVETILVKAYEQDFPGVGFKVKSCVTKSWGEELYTTKGSI